MSNHQDTNNYDRNQPVVDHNQQALNMFNPSQTQTRFLIELEESKNQPTDQQEVSETIQVKKKKKKIKMKNIDQEIKEDENNNKKLDLCISDEELPDQHQAKLNFEQQNNRAKKKGKFVIAGFNDKA